MDGVALAAARWRKEMMYPELVGQGGRARLVLFGVRQFLAQLARRKARRLVAMSLLELPGVLGADGGRWNAILFTPVWREA